jgi:hypothetical protein
VFSKIIIEGQEAGLWKELIRLLPAECQPTKAVLVQPYMGLFFIASVSNTFYAMLCIPKPAEELRGPPVLPTWTTV